MNTNLKKDSYQNKDNLTIRDIARESGVSISTVSRVINNKSRVNEKTRKRVLEVVKEFRYEPNNIARSLVKNKTNTIGVILEEILNPFFSEIAKGIAETLKKRNYTMLLTDSNFEEEVELELTRTLLRNKVDGIIIALMNDKSKALDLIKRRNIPFFSINCRAVKEKFDWVATDNFKGGYIATKYLIDLGHTKIMHIKGTNDQPSLDKYRGFRRAILDSNLNLSNQIIVSGKVKTSKDGKELIKKYIDKKGISSLPTAIFAVNDDTALGVLEILSKEGLKIPEDLSIIGYDDIYTAEYIGLTTVRQEKYKMGEIAAIELLKKLEGDEKDIIKEVSIEPKLIIRRSCAKKI